MSTNPRSASSHHGDDSKTAPSSSTSTSSPATATPSRGRGRGKSRGGLGKYLRARGRGRGGGGRPAEFHKRLVLEDEELVDIDPESEEYKESQRKYSRRQLTSNADRYNEPEPELNSDGAFLSYPYPNPFMAQSRMNSFSYSQLSIRACVRVCACR